MCAESAEARAAEWSLATGLCGQEKELESHLPAKLPGAVPRVQNQDHSVRMRLFRNDLKCRIITRTSCTYLLTAGPAPCALPWSANAENQLPTFAGGSLLKTHLPVARNLLSTPSSL